MAYLPAERRREIMRITAIRNMLTGILGFSFLSTISACNGKMPEIKAVSSDPVKRSDSDYGNSDNWLSFGGDKSKSIDLFVVYPTLTNSEEQADQPYVRIDSPLMRKAAAAWLNDLDSVISTHANIYAPLYRQINGAVLPTLPSNEFDKYANKTPREDVFAAFDYYLKAVNKGERPFILLGHSQGGQMVCELATTLLGNKEYVQFNQNHIITYAIGVSVTADMMAQNPNLTFSESATDTGVIVSWNTTAPSEVAAKAYESFGTWKQGAFVTNPITWTTNETPAQPIPFTKEFTNPLGLMPGMADAIVDQSRGLLIVTSVNETEYPVPLGGILSRYHGYDIWFFADTISQNIGDRIAAYNSQQLCGI
jgi:hypothetical protein